MRRLTLYAASRCARPEDVADLVAATFVAALQSAHRFDPARGQVFAWLVGIARNLASDSARKVQHESEALARVVGRRSLDCDEILELEERIDATRQHAELEGALKQLKVGDREALWLVGPLGLSGAQAAQALGMSPAAFRMRLMSPSPPAQGREALTPGPTTGAPRGGAAMNDSHQRLSKVERRLLAELLAFRAALPADPPLEVARPARAGPARKRHGRRIQNAAVAVACSLWLA